jgi:hypothetical protein
MLQMPKESKWSQDEQQEQSFLQSLTFYMAKTLSNKASLISHNPTILPLFFFENSFGSYHIHITRRFNSVPNLVSLKVLQLFMHGIDPT